nr:uncharacterized protein LOC127342671 isoform X1 [Lolium perenne]
MSIEHPLPNMKFLQELCILDCISVFERMKRSEHQGKGYGDQHLRQQFLGESNQQINDHMMMAGGSDVFATPCPYRPTIQSIRSDMIQRSSYNPYDLESKHAIHGSTKPSPLHTTKIVEKCTLKLVDEYKHMLCQTNEPMSTFLQYITYGHMIDNVVLIVTGTLHERDVNELLEKCHPLGMFDRYSCGSSLVSLKWEIYQNTDSSFF